MSNENIVESQPNPNVIVTKSSKPLSDFVNCLQNNIGISCNRIQTALRNANGEKVLNSQITVGTSSLTFRERFEINVWYNFFFFLLSWRLFATSVPVGYYNDNSKKVTSRRTLDFVANTHVQTLCSKRSRAYLGIKKNISNGSRFICSELFGQYRGGGSGLHRYIVLPIHDRGGRSTRTAIFK